MAQQQKPQRIMTSAFEDAQIVGIDGRFRIEGEAA
jgi:hypothetical protein